MAKRLDPVIAETLKKFGFGPDAAWDCHGTWVVYHRVLEQIAAKAGIYFDAPIVLEANGTARSVALCVHGSMGDGSSEWSIGEASPANNKNAYPYAMAEKRAKDRVILKLIGLHGLAYSEDEADDFKNSAPRPAPPVGTDADKDQRNVAPDTAAADAYTSASKAVIASFGTESDLRLWWKEQAPARTKNGLTQEHVDELLACIKARIAELSEEKDMADETV